MKVEVEVAQGEILVVDDDPYLLAALRQTLLLHGYAVRTFANPLEALDTVGHQPYLAVLADIRMPELSGMALLERIVLREPQLPVILITGHGDISMAVEAVKKGAYDFLQKPVDEDVLLAAIARAVERRRLVLENQRLERELQTRRNSRSFFYGLVGSHPAMLGLYTLIETVAHEQDPVLISGETGTGKELVARALHLMRQGERSLPYVAVNMGAIPAEMIESELFGHEKGAFTGAIQRKLGKFEFAGKGTLFLDEICSMPMQLQAKLLRVLEDRAFSRLGGNALIPLQARIIAATNRDLQDEVAKGAFRQDLFFRLNVLPIQVPPLRRRKEDIALLASYFLDEYNSLQDGPPCALPEGMAERLRRHEWPGNIRELRNVIRRFCILGEQRLAPEQEPNAAAPASADLRQYLEQQEAQYLRKTLAQSGGQVLLAHQRLGISRKSLYDKINKYAIDLTEMRNGKKPEPGEESAKIFLTKP